MKHLITVLCLIALSACASKPLELSKSAELDYERALHMVEIDENAKAILFLEKFSAKYPYSQYASLDELLRLKAAYNDGQYILSEVLSQRFVDAHPDYLYVRYLHAMSLYKQSSSALLDQQFSHKAREAFQQLNQAYPSNPYTADIQKMLQILTNRVASYETTVGKFYLDKQLYVAAANRFILVKNEYLDANRADEALHYLVTTYLALEQPAYAKEVQSLLDEHFASSPWRNISSDSN